jgi:hypothetical protein
MPKIETIRLEPIVDFSSYLGSGELVAVNVGPERQLCAVIALKKLDYRITEPSGVSFVKTKPDVPQTYRVLVYSNRILTHDVIIEDCFNIHDIQPLPNEELLLVCCRSYFRGPKDYDLNGRIYSTKGEFLREILLGDGIAQVQSTTRGEIWTSYFDEGIFGNYGWVSPVGACGLIAWDDHGNKHYEYNPPEELGYLCDCYALNVESDSSTWFYYYTDFRLVHLQDQRLSEYWEPPISGSRAFAIKPGYALFSGDYEKRDLYHLFELENHGNVRQGSIHRLIDENNTPIEDTNVFGRANSLYVVRNQKVYELKIETVLGI